jgi:hypothetical protein
VHIIPDVVSSNLDQGEVYNIMWQISSVTCDRLGPSVSSTNKSDRYDITELLLKVALNTIKQTNILKIYQIEHKIYPNHQDEWYMLYVYHRDLSRYVSDHHIYNKQ